MIFFANQWTGFHMIGTSVVEELETKRILQTHMNSQKALSLWIADSFCFLFNLHLDLRQYLTWTVKVNTIRQNPQAYSETCQTSSIERFVNIFSRCSILDFWQGFEYASEIWKSLWSHHEPQQSMSLSRYYTCPSEQLKQQNNKWNLFNLNNKKTRRLQLWTNITHDSGISTVNFEQVSASWDVRSEAVVQRCFVENVFLEFSQNSQENTCARVSFLMGLQLY